MPELRIPANTVIEAPLPLLHWEDFAADQAAEFGSFLVTADDVKDFARAYDPQPMHVDEAAAAAGMLGGLSASGWHTCAIMMRLITDGFLLNSAFMGGPGCDEIRWLAPVRPGDVLRVRSRVLEVRESRTRADAGFVEFLFEVVKANGLCVMTAEVHLMFGRREPMRAAG